MATPRCLAPVTNASDEYDSCMMYQSMRFTRGCTYFPAAAAEHGCCAAAAASRRRELRLMTDVAEPCAPFPLQLHHANLQLNLLPLPLPLTDTDSTTVLDANVFSPLHEFGASCPLPEIAAEKLTIKNVLHEIFSTEGDEEISSFHHAKWTMRTLINI